MVYRIYVEKKQGLQTEADGLRADLVNLLGIKGLTGLRLLNRYDVEHIDKELFENCKTTVFSEPQLDDLLTEIPQDGAKVFAVEFCPVSLTREQTPQQNVSRSFPNRTDLW